MAMGIRKYRNYLFSFRGRIHREDFWSRLAITFAAFIVVVIVALYMPASFIRYSLITILIVAGFAVWLSSTVQRLHDRGKSAWYLPLFFGVPTLIANFEAPSRDNYNFYLFAFNIKFSVAYLGTGSFLSLLSSAIFVWMIVELGCLRGTAGPNRYGPDSLQPAPETPAPTQPA
jgi:uncharacterized membrane protein YhaH (DUF805 family)